MQIRRSCWMLPCSSSSKCSIRQLRKVAMRGSGLPARRDAALFHWNVSFWKGIYYEAFIVFTILVALAKIIIATAERKKCSDRFEGAARYAEVETGYPAQSQWVSFFASGAGGLRALCLVSHCAGFYHELS